MDEVATPQSVSNRSHEGDYCEIQSIKSDNDADFGLPQNSRTNYEVKTAVINGPKNSNFKEKKLQKRKKKKMSNRLRSMFRGPPAAGGRVTPTDISEERFEPPTPRYVFNNGDNLQMKTIRESGLSDDDVGSTTKNSSLSYSNPAFTRSYVEEEDHRTNKRAYDSNIYSVNSAGNPVPITIESECDDGDEAHLQNCNKTHTKDKKLFTGSAFSSSKVKCCKCGPPIFHKNGKVYSLWKKTFQPDSFGMSVWLLIITLGFLFNTWSIPLRGSFFTEIQSPWQDVWFACDALFDLMFVIDLYIIFRTSYVKSGVYVTDINDLNAFHRRHWTLILDVLAIIPTDLFFIRTINPYIRLNRLLKIHRALQFYTVVEKGSSFPNVWRILNLIHVYSAIVHYNACFYYGLSETHGFGETLTSWMFPNPKFFPDYTVLYRRYTHSFYWSIGRLSVIGGLALPTTDWQYVFSIYMQLLGVVMLVILIGFITSLFIGKLTPKMEFERTIDSTRNYMIHRKLPKDLQNRVIGFYQYYWDNRQFSSLEENNLLGYLPSSIREEMEIHANFESLKQVPVLNQCEENILRQLVMKLNRRLYLPGQFIYRTGDVADEMFIVGEGVLQVVKEGHPSIYTICEGEVFGDENVLGPHQFIRRTGDVVSYGYSELYVLSYKDILATLSKYPRTLHNIRHRRKYLAMRQGAECKAFGGKYSRLSSNGVTADSAMKSLSSIQYRLNKTDSARLSNAHSSGYASNMAYSDHSYHHSHETPDTDEEGQSARRRLSLTSNYGPHFEITEKISALYEENMRNMKIAMEDLWVNEFKSLQQRVKETEAERDPKTKEISQLKQQKSEFAQPQKTPKIPPKEVEEEQAESSKSKVSLDDVIPSKQSYENPFARERRERFSTFKPRRTVLAQSKIIKTVHKETGLDMFGSMNSIPASKPM